MSMFDGIMGNLDEIAAKLGLPADQVQAMAQAVQGKMGAGGDPISALMATAQEHGLDPAQIQAMLSQGGASDLMAKATGMLDKDGDGNPLNDLGGFAKGLFG